MNRIKFNRPIPANPFTTVLDEFFNKGLNELSKSTNTTSRPSVNILEKDDAFVVELAAPGLKKEDFHINLDKDQLVIKVEQKQEEKAEAGDETNSEKEAYRRREFNYSSFSRTFHIPETCLLYTSDAADE